MYICLVNEICTNISNFATVKQDVMCNWFDNALLSCTKTSFITLYTRAHSTQLCTNNTLDKMKENKSINNNNNNERMETE